MKAVLISIKPKWCDLIRRGRKTVEVRKTCPKLEVPFKVYIYETMDGGRGSGLVFGEFVCNGFDTRDTKATWLCDAPKHYPSTTYNTFILPTIRRGSVGDVNRTATKMLQRLLGLTPDGIFGEKTENALLKVQEKHKLAVDGICGPASWRAISGANKYL